MADRQILFSGPMVRAILEGRKTQTRRALHDPARLRWRAGDRLWVRETFAEWCRNHRDVVYRADLSADEWDDIKHDAKLGAWRLRPSIHMPRWASRLTLIVEDVRVQRLRDISEVDAIAEGAPAGLHILRTRENNNALPGINHREGFANLWDSLNAKRAPWERNPWVAAISFTAELRNIDEAAGDSIITPPHARSEPP